MGRPKKNPAAAAVTAKKIHTIDGLFDVAPDNDPLWDASLKQLQGLSRVYGFSRAETPLIEDIGLYHNFYQNDQRQLSGIVSFPFAGKQLAVRPSVLPSILRSYAQNKMYEKQPVSKWSYVGITALQNPQTEKLTQDVEFGFEVFGSFNHLTEAQAISVVWEYLQSFGLNDITLEINNIGTQDSQTVYEDALQDFLSSKKYQLCDSCNEQLSGRVLNVFRCDNLDCQAIVSEAPAILDFLDPASHKHFTSILEALDELAIPYQLNSNYVAPAGYNKTNIAIKYKSKDASITVGEGGYHDVLLQSVGGKNLSSFGILGSLAAVRKILELAKLPVNQDQYSDVFLVPLGELASKKSLRLFRDLTTQRIAVYDHFGNQGVKNQLKQAETHKAPIALIIGQKEALDDMVILRDVKSGMQEIMSYDKIVEEVKKRLGR